jgi:hypothetical protein
MRRQCARPGCSAVATTTFTFDSREQTVWLDLPREGAARAGELCSRHARVLAAPRGWRIVDRRDGAETGRAPAATETSHPAGNVPPPAVARPAVARAADTPGWYPRFERGDTLDGVLDAATPLLSRAFGNVRAS